jgi:hypothetical protein
MKFLSICLLMLSSVSFADTTSAVKELENHGKEIAAARESGDTQMANTIHNLSAVNIPNYKMLDKDVGLAIGISAPVDNADDVVTNTTTGELVTATTLELSGTVINDAAAKKLISKSNVSRPISITVQKDGQSVDKIAKFQTISVITYPGSQCTLVILLGKAYLSCPKPVCRTAPTC